MTNACVKISDMGREGEGREIRTKRNKPAAESLIPNSSPTLQACASTSLLLPCPALCPSGFTPAVLFDRRSLHYHAHYTAPEGLDPSSIHRSRPLLPPTTHSHLSPTYLPTDACLPFPPSFLLSIPPSSSSNLSNSLSRSVCVNCFLSISRSLVSFRIAGVFDFTCFPIRIEVFLALVNLVNPVSRSPSRSCA
jgi:hypothetical protein